MNNLVVTSRRAGSPVVVFTLALSLAAAGCRHTAGPEDDAVLTKAV